MAERKAKPERDPETAAEWFVAIDGSPPDELAAARFSAWLDGSAEHEIALHYEKTQDPAAARQLIGSNQRLVVKLAREYQGLNQNLLDLIQEGNLGLVRSLKTYEPERGIRLSTYASWWIRAYILKYILDNARLVRFGNSTCARGISRRVTMPWPVVHRFVVTQ